MKKRRRFHDRMPENKSEYGQLIMKHVFENLLISNNVLMWYYRVRFIYKRAQYVSLNNKMSVYFNHYFFSCTISERVRQKYEKQKIIIITRLFKKKKNIKHILFLLHGWFTWEIHTANKYSWVVTKITFVETQYRDLKIKKKNE